MEEIKNVEIKQPTSIEENSNGVEELDQAAISKMSYVEQDSYFYNISEGELNLEDGINCPICRNKGFISYVENNHEKVKSCTCMKRRKLYRRFLDTGISKDQFKRYTLENYKADNEIQKYCLEKAINYSNDVAKDKKSYWLYIGGESGTGKTHLCTGIITRLLNSDYEVKYFVWNTEIPSLINQRKSFYQEEQDNYRKRIKEIKECQVLYIDDFLQLDIETKESLSVAYEIINSRYTDDSKITIISSEVTAEKLYELSKALCGRIFEKTNKGNYVITYNDPKDNYRMKKGE